MTTRMKVFLSTMWDLYFYWRFDCKERMTAGEFEEQAKLHLGFLFKEGETMPNLKDPIKELYTSYTVRLDNYYQSPKKYDFVERNSEAFL